MAFFLFVYQKCCVCTCWTKWRPFFIFFGLWSWRHFLDTSRLTKILEGTLMNSEVKGWFAQRAVCNQPKICYWTGRPSVVMSVCRRTGLSEKLIAWFIMFFLLNFHELFSNHIGWHSIWRAVEKSRVQRTPVLDLQLRLRLHAWVAFWWI